MFAVENKTPDAHVLRVYEVKGGKGLPAPPTEGLAGVWPQPPYYYLFYGSEALDAVAAWLELNPGWRLTSRYSIPYEKWQDVCAQDLHVGPFTVRAAAGRELPPRRPRANQILIDPGVVFGSGLHPTTKGCLLAISGLFAAAKQNAPISVRGPNRSSSPDANDASGPFRDAVPGLDGILTVVDFGTGTGILAIACALLGAGRTLAIDCIPFALAVARQNAITNGVIDRIGFICADRIAVLDTASDLLLMNLEWPVLEDVLGGDDWKGNGRVVLSGFLEGMLDRVEEKVRPWYRTAGKTILEGWPTLTLIRR